MPNGRTDYFLDGKYGLSTAREQYFRILVQLIGGTEHLDPAFGREVRQSLGTINNNTTQSQQNYEGHYDNKISSAFRSRRDGQNAEKKLKEYRKKLQRLINNPAVPTDDAMGYLYLTDKIMDTEAGDFGRAIIESPFLNIFITQYPNGPRINDQISHADSVKYLDSVNPVTGQKQTGPLRALNNFFYITSRLLQREYEKQQINDNFSVEKEQEYLKKLNADFKSLLLNQKTFDKLVREDGTSDYDNYLMNKLDVMTGKNLGDKDAERSVRSGIENIKGQQKAIDNGWGMNELELAGHISEMADKAAVQKKLLEKQLAPERLEHQRQVIHNGIETNRNNPEALQIWQTRLAEAQVQEAENRAKLERVTVLEEKLKELDQEFKNTDVRNQVSAKYPLVEKFDKLANENVDDPVLGYLFRQGLKVSKTAMEYGGIPKSPVKISDEVKQTTISEDEYKSYNGLMSLSGVNTVWVSIEAPAKEIYGEKVQKIVSNYQQELMQEENSGLSDTIKFGPFRNPVASQQLRNRVQNNTLKLADDTVNVLNAIMDDSLYAMKGARKEAKRSYDPLFTVSATNKGNFSKAISENYHLFTASTQYFGNSPEIFLPEKCSAEEVVQWLKENEVLEPYNAFSEAGKELFELEFEKQRMQQTGWDEGKERYYLARLEENINKTEKAMEKLQALPLDVQENRDYMGNTLGHATGNDSSNTTRDCLPTYEGLRWMREGIKNGWNSRDLNVLMIGGIMEGNIRRAKLKMQNKITKAKRALENNEENPDYHKDTIRKCEDLLTFTNEFEKTHFKPLKESVLGRKIKSPADVIKTVNQIQDFYNRFKDEPKFTQVPNGKGYETFVAVFDSTVNIAKDRLFPDAINRNLKEIEEQKKTGPKPEPDRNYKYSNKKTAMNKFLNSLRNKPGAVGDKNLYRMEAQFYLYHRFLHGLNEDAHPELFDPKHPDFKASTNSLAKFTEQYADRLVDVLDPKDPKAFADALEFGNHEDMFAEMRNRIPADAAKARYESFLRGKPLNKTMDKNLSNTATALSKATANFITGSDLYDSIESGIKELEEMKNKLAAELVEKSRKDHRVYLAGYELDENGNEDRNSPIYKFENAAEMKIPQEKLKKFVQKQDEVYGKIMNYLNGKDAIIRQKGGNPANKQAAALLGTTGEKRYKAVTDAKKAVINLYSVTREFDEKGYSYAERRMTTRPGLNLNPVEYLDNTKKYTKEQEAELRKAFIKGEKELFEENLRYNLHAEHKEKVRGINKMMDTFEQEELEKRNKIIEALWTERQKKVDPNLSPKMQEMIRNKRERVEAQRQDELVNSAIKTLYTEGLKELMEEKRKNLFRDALKKELQENMKDVDDWFPIREKYEEALKIWEKGQNIPDEELTLLEKFPKIKDDYEKLLEQYAEQGTNPPKEKMDEYHNLENKYNELVKLGEATMFIQKHEAEYNEKKPLLDEFITGRYEERSRQLEEKMEKGTYPKELMSRIDPKDIKALSDEYEKSIVNNEENRKRFADFKQKAVGKEPFNTEFRNRIILSATTMKAPLTGEEIVGIRNDILKGHGSKSKSLEAQNAKGPKAQNAKNANGPEANNANEREAKVLNPKNVKPSGGMKL